MGDPRFSFTTLDDTKREVATLKRNKWLRTSLIDHVARFCLLKSFPSNVFDGRIVSIGNTFFIGTCERAVKRHFEEKDSRELYTYQRNMKEFHQKRSH